MLTMPIKTQCAVQKELEVPAVCEKREYSHEVHNQGVDEELMAASY